VNTSRTSSLGKFGRELRHTHTNGTCVCADRHLVAPAIILGTHLVAAFSGTLRSQDPTAKFILGTFPLWLSRCRHTWQSFRPSFALSIFHFPPATFSPPTCPTAHLVRWPRLGSFVLSKFLARMCLCHKWHFCGSAFYFLLPLFAILLYHFYMYCVYII